MLETRASAHIRGDVGAGVPLARELHMNQDHPEFDSEDLSQNPPETDPLKAEIESLRSEIALVKADALRERADLENQRKRIARDVENARKFANEKLLGELLPVFDSLDAGLAAAGTEPSPLRDGLDLTYKQLLKVAADNGLTLLDPVGQPFNPDQHQAISQGEAEGIAPGHVVQVFQKGYLLNERLLRPALVVVAKHD
ncbi:nucleotide exchange factor GrpE [Xanthomonas campestris pv. incanae]|nr:nucleotide exchange factor GrpE [Xanthomonas campestris pv. incanae]